MIFLSICASTFDPSGAVVLSLDPDSKIEPAQRRVERTATLDGFAVLDDRGWTASDNQIEAKFKVSRETESTILRLATIHRTCTAATRYGVYRGTISNYRIDGGKANLTFLIEKQISA